MTGTVNALPFRGRRRGVAYAVLALAVLCIVGPFAWILMNSFKQPIAILTGAWSFTPTLANYADVLMSRRSDFAANVANSLIVATASTALVLVIGTLAAYSLYRFRWARWVTSSLRTTTPTPGLGRAVHQRCGSTRRRASRRPARMSHCGRRVVRRSIDFMPKG